MVSRWVANIVIFGATEMARVLIVDDDAASVQTLVRVLRECGEREIRVAASAAGALRAAVEFRPAVIFLDIELPDMGGYELATLLHQHPQLQHMRLIALTGEGGASGARACACLRLRALHREAHQRCGGAGG